MTAYAILTLMLGIVLYVTAGWASSQGLGPEATVQIASLIVFWGVLPLVNAGFDWLSVGATRYFLRFTAHRRNPVLNSLCDFASALLILLMLAVVMTAAVQAVNLIVVSRGSAPWVDVADHFRAIRLDPGNPALWWIYFTLFSTLVPTLIHSIIGGVSLITSEMPAWLRQRYRDRMEEPEFTKDPPRVFETAVFLTVRSVLGFVLGTAFFGVLLWGLLAAVPWLASWLLCACELTAAGLGAPLAPGQCSGL